MERPRISIFLAVSLDGYIAGENNDLAWLMEYSGDTPESTGYTALMDSVDTMVFGRNTYDVVLPFDPWPYAGKKIFVLTRRPLMPKYGEEAYNGPLDALLPLLVQRGGRHVYLDGGDAARQGLALGVVDELTLSWIPIILGKGVPLFSKGLPLRHWRLQSSRALPSGILQGKYVPDELRKAPQRS
jgi:dihydrofolate reductase